MPAIERLLLSEKLSLQDLARIAAITGPGGFMSQRVELSLANALAWSLKIPIAGIHLSEMWKARSCLITDIPLSRSLERGVPQDGVRTVWLHSTQKKSLFIRGFGALEKKWPDATLISLDEAGSGIPKNALLIGELIPEHEELLMLKRMPNPEPVENVLPMLCEKQTYGDPPVLPWYGRGI